MLATLETVRMSTAAVTGQVAGSQEVSILIPPNETCPFLSDRISPVTDFASSVAAFEQILGTLEHFTIHSSKTIDSQGKKFRFIDIRDLFGSTILKVGYIKEKKTELGNYKLAPIQQVFIDSSDRPIMKAAEFKHYNPTTETVLLAGQDSLGFITNKTHAFTSNLNFTVKTQANGNANLLPVVPTLEEVEMLVRGYSGCFCTCYNCGTDKPGGIRFHSKNRRQQEENTGENNSKVRVNELLADMESLSKREYADMMSKNLAQNFVNRDDDLENGIAQLHIWGNVPTLLKMWILYVAVHVFQSSFEKRRCCGCCLIRFRIRWCWSTIIMIFILIAFFTGTFYKLLSILWSLKLP